MSVWGDIAGLFGFDSSSATAQAEASLGGGGGLTAIAATLDAFFADVTSIAMWRSIGWLAIGAAMMYAGLYLWLKGRGIDFAPPVP